MPKKKQKSELRKMVAYAYGNVLLSEENLKIVNSNITLLENNVRDLTKVYENGLIEAGKRPTTTTDLVKFEKQSKLRQTLKNNRVPTVQQRPWS